MKDVRIRETPESWLRLIFSAKAAQSGGVIRRSNAWIEREVGRELFENDVRRLGFHLIDTGTQLVVICHRGSIRLIF